MTPTHSEGMAAAQAGCDGQHQLDGVVTDAELLAMFSPDEVAIVSRALGREAEAVTAEGGTYRKPTWHELWEAGWVEAPRCDWPFPTEAELLSILHKAGDWVEFWGACKCGKIDCNAILQALNEREPKLLKRSVTKRYGIRWRLRDPNPH